jgi:hypothetical protein
MSAKHTVANMLARCRAATRVAGAGAAPFSSKARMAERVEAAEVRIQAGSAVELGAVVKHGLPCMH